MRSGRSPRVDRVERQAAPVALVGEASLHVAVGHDYPALRERGPHHLGDVLGLVGEVQQQLRGRCHAAVRGIEKHIANGEADGGTPRLAGQQGLAAQPLDKPLRLGALAAALDPLERDERHPWILAVGAP
jgi:hypothetical protein